MVASWISPESSPANPSRMIVVVLEIPEAEKLADRARRLADDWGGKVVNEGISLDGEVAWRVQRNAAPVFQPVEAIITGYHEQFYLIYGSASGSNSCHEEMEVIRTSWKWTSIDTPAHHLEFRSQPITTFNGKVSLNFPAVANTFKTDNPQRTFGLSITNIIEKSFDFDAVMKLGEFSTGDTLEAACERVGTGTQKLHGLSESFVWRAVRGSRESVMTQPLLVPSPNRPFYVLLAIARLDGNQFVLVNFSIFTRDPGERSEYVVAAQRIVESIAINNPPSQ